MTPPAYVLLKDGTRFDGLACGALGRFAVGEIVFTTSMAGYQEAMTDPSYRGQLITFTFPMIGNYGAQADAMESDRVHARAAIMRAAVDRDDAPGAQQGWLSWLAEQGIPAITEIDTRALVRLIRDQGAMRGGVFPGEMPEAEASGLIAAEPDMAGRDLARQVTPGEVVVLGDRGGPRIAMIDTGVKRSIVANLQARGATVELHPCTGGP
ncbi:MAG: carbamoyl-phosphate synthase small subunit, partial [Solirubrobacterales bacterium]|nr:carbamoyl-phosphate synthase small subunit [Solirubrobacterales bacterium]